MTNTLYKAAISIDLGARSTGLFTVVHPANRFPTKADALTAAILVPDDSGFTASQKARTMRRHVIRSKKRYAMAVKNASAAQRRTGLKERLSQNKEELNHGNR